MVLCRVRLTVQHSCSPHQSLWPLPCVPPSASSLQMPRLCSRSLASILHMPHCCPRSADVPRLGALQATFPFSFTYTKPHHVHEVLSLHPAVCPFLFPSTPLTIPASHPVNSLVFSLTSAPFFTCVHVASLCIPSALSCIRRPCEIPRKRSAVSGLPFWRPSLRLWASLSPFIFSPCHSLTGCPHVSHRPRSLHLIFWLLPPLLRSLTASPALRSSS